VLFVTCNIDIADSTPRENNFALPAGQYIEIAVKDTGVGISPEVIAKYLSRSLRPKIQAREWGWRPSKDGIGTPGRGGCHVQTRLRFDISIVVADNQ